MGRRLGLLIGINRYYDSAFQPLRYAESDATMLARWLGNPRGGDWSSANIYTLTGAEATKGHVEDLVVRLCLDTAQPDDLVLIYFAGHAFIDENSGEGLLACADTVFQSPSSAVHLGRLVAQVVAPSRAAQVAVVLDCFQSGAPWDATAPFDFRPWVGRATFMRLQQSQGRLLYCSCRGNDRAAESGEQGCGSFVYRAIVGLSGAARDRESGQATLQQLHVYLSGALSTQHRPQVFGQAALPIVLAGSAPAYAGVVSPAYVTSTSAGGLPATPPHSAAPPGQVTFQGIGEFSPLATPETSLDAATAAAGQFVSPTSGPISISLVEQNYQQQCVKLLQQARALVAAQNLPDAYQLVEQVLHMAPRYGDALVLKTQILGTTGQNQEALATNEQLLQWEPDNVLAWSMYAALLTNSGRPQEALTAIDRALVLQPGNQQALAMRQAILSSLSHRPPAYNANTPGQRRSPDATRSGTRESAGSFLTGAGIQVLAFMLGLLGAGMLVYRPTLPNTLGFALESFGLAALCVLAASGSFRYGATRLFSTVVLCIASAGILGGLYKFQYAALIHKIAASPSLIVPVFFLAAWLIVAAALPFLAGVVGFIGGMALGVRRK